MTTIQSLQSAIELILILLVAYGIFKQETLIKFEKKVWFYTKCFLKALYYTIAEKLN